MNKRRISIFFTILSMAAMALPNGVAMDFGAVAGKILTKEYSYFSMIPLGYGNCFPWLSVILSVVVLMILFIKPDWTRLIDGCLFVSVLGQVLSWILFSSFRLTALLVVLLQLLVLWIQWRNKPPNGSFL
ncbi:hypothetical protein [Clostridium minihomine]|uniref:hypothetical protein n=1 Tax=Clostridium minihomine TaxID=2045012 RepID=UPI000C75CA05|nr:hypothetical protein [Clostridium minihomine]